jgi:hypothetical protein
MNGRLLFVGFHGSAPATPASSADSPASGARHYNKVRVREGAFHDIGDVAAFIVSGSPVIRHLFALPAKRLYEALKDSLSHAAV